MAPVAHKPTYQLTLGPAVLYITRGTAIAGDALVLIVTWVKTFGVMKRATKEGMPLTVSTCLLRDGAWHQLRSAPGNMS